MRSLVIDFIRYERVVELINVYEFRVSIVMSFLKTISSTSFTNLFLHKNTTSYYFLKCIILFSVINRYYLIFDKFRRQNHSKPVYQYKSNLHHSGMHIIVWSHIVYSCGCFILDSIIFFFYLSTS